MHQAGEFEPAALGNRRIPATLSIGEELRVAILCPTSLYRDALVEALEKRDGLGVVASGEHVEDVTSLGPDRVPGVVLFDATGRDATRVARSLKAALPRCHIVAISVGDDDEVVALAEAGVSGYLPRHSSIDELVATLACVVRSGELTMSHIAAVLSRRLNKLSRAADEDGDGRLTPRETQIIGLIEQGKSNKEIARHLDVALQTVKNHIHNVLAKLEVKSRSEVGAWARRNGFIRAESR
jgi:two-component system nitrate/nitrite response regulator NarL